jgi:hypothetical protein
MYESRHAKESMPYDRRSAVTKPGNRLSKIPNIDSAISYPPLS